MVRICDLMSRDVITVRPETPLKEVARLLAEHAVSGLPVVSESNVVVGVVSESDFMIKERGRANIPRSPLRWLLGDTERELARVEATTAGEVMTTPPITIEGRFASVREAAIVMAGHNINRLPVTESGTLVGIITRGDLLRVYTRSDETIEAAARDALRAVESIVIEGVHEGIVTLVGTGESKALVETTVQIAEAIDGVVAVDTARLTWREEPEPARATTGW
jgi:CBS domain-containing protein